VTKRFGEKEALKGVSIDFKKGEVVSLLGANGAGKTTLSSILATLRPPTSGDVLYRGVSIYTDVMAFRLKIGYCPQRPNFNKDLTMYENLEFGGLYFGMSRDAVRERIAQLTEKLSLQGFLHNYPDSLSGGYKQRFMIARSLLHNPDIIILDEPTVALDPHVRLQLWEYIKAMRDSGITIILTTHYIDEAEYLSDRVCVLENGLIKLVDTPKNLMETFKKSKLEDVFIHLMKHDE
jgi:ABC-2 type transport system ATP-binding protein